MGEVPSVQPRHQFRRQPSKTRHRPHIRDQLSKRHARARFALRRGMGVSAAAIRDNPNLKRNVCQFVGRDIRIYQACIDANSVGRRGW